MFIDNLEGLERVPSMCFVPGSKGDVKMELSQCVLDRTERVARELLLRTGQSDDILPLVLFEAAEVRSGVLFLLDQLDFIAEFDSDKTPEEEAEEILMSCDFGQEGSEVTIDDLVDELIRDWCDTLYNLVGNIARVSGGLQKYTLASNVRPFWGESEDKTEEDQSSAN